MPDQSKIFDEITKIIEGNGEVTQRTKDQLILMALGELHRVQVVSLDAQEKERDTHREQYECIEDEIKELKRNSLLLWAKSHPGWAVTVTLFVLVASDLVKALLILAGVPIPIIP